MASRSNHQTSSLRAEILLNQQIWCWGRDVLRPEGNWLLEVGFERMEPPTTRSDCPSAYRLELPKKRWVLLRGFGIFYGDRRRGGIFLPRFDLRPRYTPNAMLDRIPWSKQDLPKFGPPRKDHRSKGASLTLDAIDWILDYEGNVRHLLGIDYRRSTLEDWDDGERSTVPAEAMMSGWRDVHATFAAEFKQGTT